MHCQNRLVTCTDHDQPYVKMHDTLEVYYYPKTFECASSPFSFALWKAFPEHAQWADIIHYHFPWPMADLLHWGHHVKKPSVITYHSDIVRQKYWRYLYQPLMKSFLKKMKRIIATSYKYIETSSVLQPFKEKTSAIPIGLDAKHYHIDSLKQASWREKLPADFLLFVGVLRYYKGLEYLLEALKDINIPITLVIAGDGPLMKALQIQAKSLPQSIQIIFTGFVEDADLCALYSLATALIIPASHRSEAYCIALVEGLLFGLPLISTELGTGTSFVNQHEETGLVVPACDPSALREAILTLLKNKPCQQRMRIASRQRFEAHFTAKVMAKAYVYEYNRITAPEGVF